MTMLNENLVLSRRVGLMALLIAVAFASPVWSAEPTIQDVIKAWRNRQARCVSADYVWDQTVVESKGDAHYQSPHRMALDGQKLRYEYETRGLTVATGKYETQRYLCTFDGQVCKSYLPRNIPDGPPGSGYVHPNKRHKDVTNVNLRPLLMAYRPMHAELGGFNAAEYYLTAEPIFVRDKRCLSVAQRPKAANKAHWVYWVDPAMDYSIVRMELRASAGWTNIQIDIDHVPDESVGWAVSHWRHVQTQPNGLLIKSFDATVSKRDINSRLEAREFDIAFPDGTVVTDMTAKSAMGNLTVYHVKEGGEKRIMKANEMGITYEQAMNTESGMGASFHSRPRWVRWLVWSLLSGAVVVSCVLIARRFGVLRQLVAWRSTAR